MSALVLGVVLFVLAARFAMTRSEGSARALFFGSITYLPLLWIMLIGDKL
jgi:heme O synthase-like polyprenyltransferase